ncbi:MAG: hypothetical protein ACKVPX_18905 [Myxococcaceae bacterium]
MAAAPEQLLLFSQEASRLPAPADVRVKAEALAFRLSHRLGLPVRLAITDNRSSLVSFRRSSAVLRLRLHHMFLDAPSPVVHALARYAGRGQRAAGRVLDDFMARQRSRLRIAAGTRRALRPEGRCVNLKALFDALNAEHFSGAIEARIGWGKPTPPRRRKSIRLGVYDHHLREIRIHPALDRPEVPHFFVAYIVFHEMLHQLWPTVVTNQGRVHHPPGFRARERAFPGYAAAIRWERNNWSLLLRG